MPKKIIEAGIYGASGYTAGELLRILFQHPHVHVRQIVSHSHAGTQLANLHSHLAPIAGDQKCISLEQAKWEECDCVFLATPNGVAMGEAEGILGKGAKLIDLSADFRIKDISVWNKWYKMEHAAPQPLAEAVYGLPEAQRSAIRSARLIANPGCYATAIQLALLPLLADADYSPLFDGLEIIANASSGTSGAGRACAEHLLLSEAGEDFTCYAPEGHRHQPEMEEHLVCKYKRNVKIRFMPHLLPVSRGIFAALYIPLHECKADTLRALYKKFYEQEPFVRVLSAGKTPHIKSVRGSNYCELAIFRAPDSCYVQVCSVLDNLVKGAAGQAVQNMNITFGLTETVGLSAPGLCP